MVELPSSGADRNSMLQRVLADLVLVVHLGFVVFVLAGGLLALRWRWVPWVHLPAAFWGAFIELSGGICPLTPLENRLRAAAGEDTYTGDFIAQLVGPVLYPPGLTREIQLLLAVLLVAFNALVYTTVWRRHRLRRRERAR
jgi:hypothetical protein